VAGLRDNICPDDKVVGGGVEELPKTNCDGSSLGKHVDADDQTGEYAVSVSIPRSKPMGECCCKMVFT
jgi:hypothetical protein